MSAAAAVVSVGIATVVVLFTAGFTYLSIWLFLCVLIGALLYEAGRP